jgi:uncharacterized membrane protein
MSEHWFDASLHLAARVLEGGGVAVIVLGALFAVVSALQQMHRSGAGEDTYQLFRIRLGRSILLGLELLVAADIIGTVAVEPTVQNLLVLALIVLIRTFLSISLEVEIDGYWPWQKARIEREQTQKEQ